MEHFMLTALLRAEGRASVVPWPDRGPAPKKGAATAVAGSNSVGALMFKRIGQFLLVAALAGPASASALLSETFDDISSLAGAGWVMTNNSAPVGSTGWFQGNDGIFAAHSGAPDSYIAANFLNADFGGNISNWLLTPTMTLWDGVTLTFFTRTVDAPLFPDRLEVRLSTNGASTDVGATDASLGDFSTLLLAINPALDVAGYPSDWTQFTVEMSGLGGMVDGRIGFRYFVTDTSINADYIGIDSVSVQAVPEPGLAALMMAALASAALPIRRRKA